MNPFHRPGALEHQLVAFERFKDSPHYALFWDPRCRKTSVVLAHFRRRCELDPKDLLHVDALIVLSWPSGVKWVWAEEARAELPPDFLAGTKVLVWESGRTAKTTARKKEALELRAHEGPIIFSANCESILTDNGNKYIEWLIAGRRVMLVVDETWMANWSARTQRALAYSRRPNVVVKALLDGTPVDESPEEIFYPSQFLKPGLLGYADKTAFQARHCEYQVEEVEERLPNGSIVTRVLPAGKRFNRAKAAMGYSDPYDRYPVFKRYRNLDELREKMLTFGSRVRREDVTDAPPKTYVSQYFEMSPKQREVYDNLLLEYAADLESGRRVTAPQVLYRMTRLQMVARNYWPPERTGVACPACDGYGFAQEGGDCPACGGLGSRVVVNELEIIDPNRNPAIDALLEAVNAVRQPFVVWCRFRQDVADAVAALLAAGHLVWEHHGGVPDAQAEANYQAFKAGGPGAPAGIVGTIGGGLGRGKDLSRATLAVFYSNDFALRLRRQAEDRTEGVLRRVSTTVVDLIAAETRDVDVIDALRAKRELAAEVMGDPRPWFSCTGKEQPNG